MDKSAETPSTEQISTSTPPTDDESITTSTESDSLDTWTLITDKHKLRHRSDRAAASNTAIKTMADTANDSKIEDLTQEKDNPTASKDESDDDTNPKVEEESAVDDLSDGISIISESDSAGRISPHSFLREHLSNLNLKFNTGQGIEDLPSHVVPPTSPIILPSTANPPENKALRQRRSRRTHSSEKELQHTDDDSAIDEEYEYEYEDDYYPCLRSGVTGLFFICIILSLLAFIVKWRYPEWQPFGSGKQLSVLEQKINEIELQNNLMRAEIDILSKQVNYLSNLDKDSQHGKDDDDKVRKYQKHIKRAGEWIMEQKKKAFEAWSGNGDTVEPVTITKEELKRPYKCTDGNFVEVAGMCVEKRHQKDSLVDGLKKIGNILAEELEDSVKTLLNGGKPTRAEREHKSDFYNEREWSRYNDDGNDDNGDGDNDVNKDDVDNNDQYNDSDKNSDDNVDDHNADDKTNKVDDDDVLEVEDVEVEDCEYFHDDEDGNYLKYMRELHNKNKFDGKFRRKHKGVLRLATEQLLDNFYIDKIKSFFGSKERSKGKQNNANPYYDHPAKRQYHLHRPRERYQNANAYSKENFSKDIPNKETVKPHSRENYNQGTTNERFLKQQQKEHFNKGNSKERFNKNGSEERLKRDEPKKRSNKKRSEEHFEEDEHRKNFARSDSNERFLKDQHRKQFNRADSKEHFNKDRSRERFNKDDSVEHFNKDSSNELSNKDDSKERRQSGERKKYDSAERDDESGEWHEKLMQQRENIRRQNELNNKKNWYIERGDEREQMRHR